MIKFEQINTEYAGGHQGGIDYGSKVRVLMRSPEKIMFVGYGVNVKSRGKSGWPTKIASDSKKDTITQEAIRKVVVEHFGKDADEWLIKAVMTRGKGTILVDGGGEKLSLPQAERAKIFKQEYAEISPTHEIAPENLKRCIQCGNNLQIKTEYVYIGYDAPHENHPRTVEDCQRRSNAKVVKINGYASNTPREWWPYVAFYYTWDGESYKDDHFCSDECAGAYGRRAAVELARLPAIKL